MKQIIKIVTIFLLFYMVTVSIMFTNLTIKQYNIVTNGREVENTEILEIYLCNDIVYIDQNNKQIYFEADNEIINYKDSHELNELLADITKTASEWCQKDSAIHNIIR